MLGFQAGELDERSDRGEVKSGLWLKDRLRVAGLDPADLGQLAAVVGQAATARGSDEAGRPVELGGAPHLLFSRILNPGSRYSPACQVCLYPLAASLAEQRRVRWQILEVGGLVLLCGLVGSHFVAARLSAPAEKLAVDSERRNDSCRTFRHYVASTPRR